MDQQLFSVRRPQEKNIKELLFKYVKYWPWFLIGTVVCITVAFFHIRYNITPQYHISSTLLIKEKTSNPILPEGFTGADKTLGSEILILRSKNLMYRVFAELGLNTSYHIEGRFNDVEVYKDILPISLIVSRIDPSAYGKSIKISYLDHNNFRLLEYGDESEVKESTYRFGQEISTELVTFTVVGSANLEFSNDIIVKFHDIKEWAEHFNQLLSVELETKDANVVRLSLTDPVPQRSIMILNKLVEVYNKEAIEDKNQVDFSTIEFLDERIRFLSIELTDVEREVENYKQLNNLTDVGSNAAIYLQTASEYDKEVESFELQLEILNSLEAYVNQEELKLVPNSLNIADPTLNGLIAKFNELQLERQRMLRTIQPSSSLIVNLDDQLNNLKLNISENLKNIRNGMMITRNNLQSTSAQFQSKIRQVPSIERELLEINRQQNIKQSIYLFLLQSREEAGLALASVVPVSRIIDSAEASGPINSSTSSIYLAAFSLGLLIPFAFIYLKDFLNDRIQTQQDVIQDTEIPILGEICHNQFGTLVVGKGNNSSIVEMFRLIRTKLHFAAVDKENKVMLITSSISGEGKTFFGINLAASFILTGKKVLLIDLDLRNPQLSKELGLQDGLGISDYIVSNDLQVKEIIRLSPLIKDLNVVGSGPIPIDPSELMMSSKLFNLIKELRPKFDHIIIDAPPVGQVSDAFNLKPVVDSTLYLIRYNFTHKNMVKEIEKIRKGKELPNLSLILNDGTLENSYGYGYKNKA